MTRVEAYRILGILLGNTHSEEERVALSMAQNDLEFVDLMPDDVVVVTRCRDCENLVLVNVNGTGIPICRISGRSVKLDDFCSYGERRDDGKRGNDTGD